MIGLATILIGMITSCDRGETDADASGLFEATEVLVSSEANGRIMAFGLEEGDRLSAGQLVGYVDSTQLFLRKEQLRASIRSVDIRRPDIRKQIAVLEQQVATTETELQRQRNLVAAKAGNQKQVDDLEHQLAYLRRQVEAQYSSLSKSSGGADAEAESLQYQVMQLDDQLMKCQIRNPRAGTVLAKYAEAGEVTAVGKPLYKVADLELLYLRVYITADQLALVKLGDEVAVQADYGDDHRSYMGTVTWIADKSEFTPKGIQTKNERENLVYAVKVAVRNDGFLKIGQYGEVRLKKEAR
ncbi:MAG TPA: HlyD family efflux transporter periplasmic adaptor subunit [Candidatus Parabacteroides intestinipullorum]|uniref:HlyD family efflux transporter periplasmic adaptor subunit n=1 Tax=Candidatus Parabacteroides intestinipullorum TaxID=2838723 RepID=A0A9D2BGE8_9BACT|nr:HlyD family efflux transporter periplasmic adaptor subunit [Candidatus Parabacteroides intestinipullorum]